MAFWLIADLAEESPYHIRPLVALFAVANLSYAMLVWKYFFTLPLIFDLSLVVILTLAFVSSEGRGKVLEKDA